MKIRSILATGLATLTVFAFACGGSSSSAEYASDDTSEAAENHRACVTVKKLAQICYDESHPDTECTTMRKAMVTEASKAKLKLDLQLVLGELCQTACKKRKEGVEWSQLEERLSCDK